MTRWGLSLAQRLELHSIPEPNSGCLLWTGCCPFHGVLKYKGAARSAHRLAWEAAKGPISKGMHVLHKCDTRGCINVDHLFLGTQVDNTADMVAKGRHSRGPSRSRLFQGQRHNNSKLTNEQVLAIRADLRSEVVIAAEYGINRSVVGMLRRRDRWTHLPDESISKTNNPDQPEAFPHAEQIRRGAGG